ncbi:MG2 domain-containing protein [Dyadobacter jejuensis]|uniref:MG2 domain-containing protein n=1 Tax=Dyadobacter jejuensis TaxID=1082580 RepID=A0A316AQ27_9BACT|nr:alpha-2-macroglobulin family protein [Dyadobacter jejuensis]PWJ59598.1 MG2 domain-containing protein [Dyadobacter jejuensis]
MTYAQQQDPYKNNWKRVEDHIKNGLPKSALAEVEKIYDSALQDHHKAESIKALVYKIDLSHEIVEEDDAMAFTQLEKALKESEQPARSILASLLAQKYWNYYQQIRWQLYDRTATKGFDKVDVATWTAEDFHQKIGSLYMESIREEKLLKQTALKDYSTLIQPGNTRALRPTLYDLLTHEALQYFQSDERDLHKPAYAFEINSASAMDPAADFAYRKFDTKDSSSLQYQALLLYQRLIAFHLSDKTPDALIDVDLHRLQYVRQHSVHPDKETQYYQSIKHVADQYQATPAAAQAWYLLASYYNNLGDQYAAGQDSSHRYEKLKAVEICKKVIHENPKTEGGVNAWNLLQSIERRQLDFTSENVNIPDQPFRMLVEYANFTKLYIRVYANDPTLELDNYYQDRKSFWKNIQKLKPVQQWSQALPDPKDYQRHSLEIKMESLPAGEYVICTSSSEDFDPSTSELAFRKTHISNISFFLSNQSLFVLHRDSGKPLVRAQIQIWDNKYLNGKNILVKKEGGLYQTNSSGKATITRPWDTPRDLNASLDITYQKDRLHLKETIRTYSSIYPPSSQDEERRTWLFTDRSLYRPGQTVFYKGIIAQGQALFTDSETEIPLEITGANGEVIEKRTVRVNEYGSFSGKLMLPTGGLNGTFSITVDGHNHFDIEVEEYKRPKFEVVLDTLQGTYNLGQTLTVTGTAQAYAGNAIDGAKVQYRIVRNRRFLYPWMAKGWWYAREQPMEIAHGSATTDANGHFSISFEAIPDRSLTIESEPVFTYTIYADVTDAAGETRSANQAVSVGYKCLVIDAPLSGPMGLQDLEKVKLRTENLNGAFVSSDMQVRFSKLMPEQRLIRPRLWSRPDLFLYSKSEYLKLFPHDEYDRESEPESWKTEAVLFETRFTTVKGQPVDLSSPNLSSGYYKVTFIATDSTNQEVTVTQYIQLQSESDKSLPRPEYLSITKSQAIEPGASTSVTLASSATGVYLIEANNRGSQSTVTYSFPKIKKGINTYTYQATEADRGGYAVRFVFVKHNRIFQFTETIRVPWTNKDLHIAFETFRDKTLPGSSEQWKVKITGHQKEQVAAEMLASMYDASLDQFYPHQWQKPDLWPTNTSLPSLISQQNFGMQRALTSHPDRDHYKPISKAYDHLIHFQTSPPRMYKGMTMRSMDGNVMAMSAPEAKMDLQIRGQAEALAADPLTDSTGNVSSKSPTIPLAKVRTNFNETAFFTPDLRTNENGEITFSFTLPDALTRWKFQALAHTKNLALGYISREIVTQKELMVQPNAPRFIRQGDKLYFPTKVVNVSDQKMDGTVRLTLRNAATDENLDVAFKNQHQEKPFSLAPGQSVGVTFSIEVPRDHTEPITYTINAQAGSVSDAEQQTIPVLSNRLLVTESLPLSLSGSGQRNYRFDKLTQAGKSNSLTHQSLTVEYTSNPAWYAIQALPYLMEYPYDCAEQTWNRYYANSLAASLVEGAPQVAQVMSQWQHSDSSALLSNLQKNQELKSILLEETPWVLAAKTEEQQKKNIALLFDLVRMRNELSNAYDQLRQKQGSSGAFSWFDGGPDDRYITQYILTGIGHLQKTKAVQGNQSDNLQSIVAKAIPYLDSRMQEDYETILRQKQDLKKVSVSPTVIHYLYMRSFFKEIPVASAATKAFAFFQERAKTNWVSQSKYLQGLTALALFRAGDKAVANAILKSLKETSILHDEMGMYWKDTRRGWWWYESPVERQALLIEVFQEIEGDPKTVNALKTWLLKNKQTNAWESTKATAEACYALIAQGSDWLSTTPTASIQLGQQTLRPTQVEAGTGYFKTKISGEKVQPDMGQITLKVTSDSPSNTPPSWGAVYWQYFEDMDKITFAETPLKLSKQLFLESNTDKGPVLTPIHETDRVNIGDKIKVRIELRVDRDMEYVHMKDLRASSLEPVQVLSGYRYQDGLGYYESTKDASTNFFFNRLPKGTYVFEYLLIASHQGDFSNGITSIQCMYAPEFTAHSKGVRLLVE